MESTSGINCLPGVVNFGDLGALASNQRYMGCASKRSRQRHAREHFHQQHEELPSLSEFVPESPIHYEEDPKAPFDATFNLVRWI